MFALARKQKIRTELKGLVRLGVLVGMLTLLAFIRG